MIHKAHNPRVPEADDTGSEHRGVKHPGAKARGGRLSAWKRKLVAVAFGLVLAHLMLELLLRVLGFAYYYERTHHPSNHPESAYVILAVGDSVTYGYCSSDPETMSYPAQLRRLLKEHAADQDIRIEKMGFPGANSSQIARRLEGFLNLHDPDLLILLIGNNDLWNLEETRAGLFAGNADWKDRLKIRIGSLLDAIRVFRFYKWIWLVVDDRRKTSFQVVKGVAPDSKHFRKGVTLFGEIGNIQLLYEHNFRAMLQLARKRNIEVMVLDYHRPARLRETEYLGPALAKLGIEMVDLEPHFREAEAKGIKVITSHSLRWHPNDAGYAICARVVFNELVRRGIVHTAPLKDIVQ